MDDFIYLDIGNSNAKWKFKGRYFQIPTNEFILDELPKSSKIWASNVSSNFVISSKSNISLVKSEKSYKSLTNSYDEPNLLGSDRWLAMVASYENSPSTSFIVVDIGTAITIDLVDKNGLHLGGVIFPGLSEIRNIFDFPISNHVSVNEVSRSTIGAWSTGTLEIIVNGINQKIHELNYKAPHAKIYLTGGGFDNVKKFLNFSYIYHKNLVLDGLELFANNMG